MNTLGAAPAWRHSQSTAGRLEIGLSQGLHIREEHVSMRHDACRVLYVSDIHLRKDRSDKLSRQVLESASRCHPDVILLGGDLADGRSELDRLSRLVAELHEVAPVLAIGGNHDRRIGMDRVADAVAHGGGRWTHRGVARMTHGERVIAISGPEAAPDLDADVRILCAHDPRIWKMSRGSGYDLVLAGHLHGCQLVAWEYRDRLFPGALLYRHCFLSHHCGSTRLVVSRGVSDLVPVRWRCPREVVLCHV